jgi:hypothetical protein
MAVSKSSTSQRERAKRSDPSTSLPHATERDGQPYTKEVEDYSHGVASPPEEQGGHRSNRANKKTLARD